MMIEMLLIIVITINTLVVVVVAVVVLTGTPMLNPMMLAQKFYNGVSWIL